MSAEIRFPAMGTMAHIIVTDSTSDRSPDQLTAQAAAEVERLEALWSRFRPDSEISAFNAAAELHAPPPTLSPETQLLIQRAEQGREITHGRFNPTLLDGVKGAGYDQFYRSPHDNADRVPTPAAGFDPGGIGKGLAADIVAEMAHAHGATGVLVNLGGDLRVIGQAPGGGDWRIDIEDPRTGSNLTTLSIRSGAVATSSQVKRRWVDAEGINRHHLIEPSTGTSSTSPVLAVTVVAAQAWQAEVLCKPMFLDWDSSGEGAIDPIQLIEDLGAAALVVTNSIEASTSQWATFEVASTQSTSHNVTAPDGRTTPERGR